MTRSGVKFFLALLAVTVLPACGDDDRPPTPDAGSLGGWRLLDASLVGTSANREAQLSDGRLLFIGGDVTFVWSYSLELGTVVELPPLMGAAPTRHSVNRLPSGRYLALGGVQTDLELVLPGSSPYGVVYDAVAGTQALVEMADGRGLHTGVSLPDGRVLLIGGATISSDMTRVEALARCELFDESTMAFSAAAPLATGRYAHTSTPLPSGLVLVAGGRGNDGRSLASAELYDPTTSTWRTAAPMGTARARHVAVLLGTGRVLVAGGTTGASDGVTGTAEVYDPVADRWTTVAPMPIGAGGASAAALPTGDAIVTGGFARVDPPMAIRQALVFRTGTNAWQSMADMQQPRYDHSTVVLEDGHVFVGVGFDRNPYFPSEFQMEISDDAFTAR